MVISEYVTVIESDAETYTNVETDGGYTTPVHKSESSINDMSAERSETPTESGPRMYKSLDELYSETEVIEMLDELMLLKIEEPINYREAITERE